jgi:hypothetical protein
MGPGRNRWIPSRDRGIPAGDRWILASDRDIFPRDKEISGRDRGYITKTQDILINKYYICVCIGYVVNRDIIIYNNNIIRQA